MEKILDDNDKQVLLKVAREAICKAVKKEQLSLIDLDSFSPALQANGASFVTITQGGRLRGCIGGLEANQPLVLDVQEHAVAAAIEDYRFPSLTEAELTSIKIEISRLTPLRQIIFKSPEDLVQTLCVNKDGVLIRAGGRRATFLPQVWDKIPDPKEFLSHLCMKMGASPDLWREKQVDIFTYRVDKFEEKS